MRLPGIAFTLHALLQRAADRCPERPAVVGPGGSLTYLRLEEDAARSAAALSELGVRPGDRVAVHAPKSPLVVTMFYAIMRLGAAYVPIDPLAPPLRAAQLVRDADCRVLCADGERLEQVVATLGDGRVPRTLDLTGEGAAATIRVEDVGDFDPGSALRGCESDLAYILYTSGSTGRPKGVMLTHRNALAFVEWAVDRFDIRLEDRLSSHAPFHFDLSIFDLYGAAMSGACLHLLAPGEESLGASMAATIRSRKLTVWYSVPSALTLLCGAASREDLASLRTILFAGEVFPMNQLRRLRALVPQAVLANLYGPTETNVCTYHVVDGPLPQGHEPLPIGGACENQQVVALDDHEVPIAPGQVGELWVRGPTVMKGYWGDPEGTSRALRQNPLHDLYADPVYRTGDLVRRLPTDIYQFTGRRDHQVKSRGYRIELGEIETVLVSHPAVQEAAVVAVPDERIGSRLVGFVASNPPVDSLELRRHCATALPRYMVPNVVLVDSSLPLTSTGKIDRQALRRRADQTSSR